jgi:AP-3 complex subunit beta
LVLCPEAQIIRLLSRYIFSLARYDANYDVRDRARMLTSLLRTVYDDIDGEVERDVMGGVILRPEQVRLVLFDGKDDMGSDIDDMRMFIVITRLVLALINIDTLLS